MERVAGAQRDKSYVKGNRKTQLEEAGKTNEPRTEKIEEKQ